MLRYPTHSAKNAEWMGHIVEVFMGRINRGSLVHPCAALALGTADTPAALLNRPINTEIPRPMLSVILCEQSESKDLLLVSWRKGGSPTNSFALACYMRRGASVSLMAPANRFSAFMLRAKPGML